MKLIETKSTLFGFGVGLAVLGLLVMPVVGSKVLKDGGGSVASIEDETDWTLASKDGIHEYEDEVDWTLAQNTTEEQETDWTLAKNDGVHGHEEEIDWTLA